MLSCKNNIEPLNRDREYNINILYIEDNGIESFLPKDFIDIFNYNLSKLTYNILGYKIKYNLSNGMSVNNFYKANRKVIINNAKLFKMDYIDIKNINISKLKNSILSSLSNETSINIKKLFGYDYGTPLEIIAENIAPSYLESILNVWDSPVKNRNKLLDGNRFMIYTASYWRILAREFKDFSIVIVNMPITANYNKMSAKSIADGGFIDRLIIENNNIKYSKSLSIISIYNLLNLNTDYETIKNIFSYYVIQSVAIMFAKYDINEDEKHSIMSDVYKFDYINWYSNIVNFPLKSPYKTIKYYKDSIK